jgi:4'-phosphopantetheinyl transferase
MKYECAGDTATSSVVWIAHLSNLRQALPGLEALLDRRELERAARFRFPEDRARFIAGRGLLRHGLRRYAPRLPATIEMSYSNLGRPFVPAAHDAPRFSISHTRDLVALAFADEAQVGIDLEYMKPSVDMLELAERILSEDDFETFQALPPSDRLAAFYRVWTRKEAYLKARGEGIATGLREVSVAFTAEATSVVADRRDSSTEKWRLHALPVPEDYMGCLACDEADRPVACFSAQVENGEVRLEAVAPSMPLPAARQAA